MRTCWTNGGRLQDEGIEGKWHELARAGRNMRFMERTTFGNKAKIIIDVCQ